MGTKQANSQPYDSHTSPQYSLKTVWLTITLVGILLAVPGILFVGLTLVSWLIPAVVTMALLLLLQVPVYLFLKSQLGRHETTDEITHGKADEPPNLGSAVPQTAGRRDDVKPQERQS